MWLFDLMGVAYLVGLGCCVWLVVLLCWFISLGWLHLIAFGLIGCGVVLVAWRLCSFDLFILTELACWFVGCWGLLVGLVNCCCFGWFGGVGFADLWLLGLACLCILVL